MALATVAQNHSLEILKSSDMFMATPAHLDLDPACQLPLSFLYLEARVIFLEFKSYEDLLTLSSVSVAAASLDAAKLPSRSRHAPDLSSHIFSSSAYG